jgi:HSP20 family protein
MFYDAYVVNSLEVPAMATLDRWEPFRAPYDTQLNRLFSDFFRTSQDQNLTPWVPAVDIFESEQELVVKADLPDIKPDELDIRVENNILTIRGERKFEKVARPTGPSDKGDEKNYLRVERSYGSFARSFSLANTVNTEAIKADYKDGVLTLSIPKREEAKPKQIKVHVGGQAAAAAAR